MRGPILDLTEDAPERLFIRGMGGEQIWLVTLDDLGLNARLQVHGHWERVNALVQQVATKPLTKAEEREYIDRYNSMVRTLCPSLKTAQVKALGQEAREAICTAFFTHRMAYRAVQRVQRLIEEENAPTGPPSSPNSSTTTDSPPSEAADGETSP